MQKIKSIMKDNRIRNRLLMFKLGCIIIMAFLFVGLQTAEISAASGLKLYNYTTKSYLTYTGKQVKATLNGKIISKEKTPGIIIDGIALVSYKDVFVRSDIDADFVYNKPKSTVTLSRSGTTIVMTIGSKKATVNGKAVTLPVAPVKIKYRDAGITNILVPSRFVSETFGLGYTWYSAKSTVAIEKKSSVTLSYNSGKKFEYTGTLANVTIDGKKISLGNMPSIITNNTAMLRAKRVFSDSVIDADYKYNKADKSVTLSKNDNILVMKIGSPVAHLNGKPIVMDTAPIIVTNHEVGTSYVMVPGSFTASCLGYDYTWDNPNRTSKIISRKDSDISNEDKVEHDQENPTEKSGESPSPELGDTGVVFDPGTILHEWTTFDTLIAKSSGVTELNMDMLPSEENGFIYSVARDYSNVKLNTETYMIIGSKPFEKVTSKKNGQLVNLLVSNMAGTNYIYEIQGIHGNYVKNIETEFDYNTQSSRVDFAVIPENYSYDIKLSEDKTILYVTFYLNSLNQVTIGTNDKNDYITLTGMKPLKVNMSEQNGMLYIDLPYTVNSIGDQTLMVAGSKYLNLFYTVKLPDKTQLILGMQDGTQYYVSETENKYTITFQNSNGNVANPPVQPVVPEAPEVPVSEVIDIAKYELIIPKPAGFNGEQILHKDDYFNHRFSIKLPGDHTAYLAANPIINNSSVIMDVSVFLNANYETEIMISTSRLQGYEFVWDNNSIYINIGEPRDIYKNIVILDPGHGGPANGAQYFGAKEKDLNLKMLYTLGEKYFNSNPSKLKVYYTRETDVDMSLSDRAAYASKMGADLFVSLHMNASLSTAAYGTEVYYSTNNNTTNKAGLNSKTMATLFVNNLTSALGTNNRGVKSERYTVVHKNTVPAVLIELGFMSNKNDFALISDPVFQENSVRIIYETLQQIFELYPTGR
ncbi:N-acetylmuramoyl-L-alanine amidase [Mobilitalea sibirica]|uniref:N-acetylmuramoyl-L-alanine amidase n=2 Tax=Mobilitalea sibirica TaxID=1462919 RepID=A0A8J7HCG7_9FIRM|nr:N-acetylmuramoyl-L-alanine amidase [Mobilitalea sibirica]